MKNEYPIAALAEVLEVSRSGFFAHRRKGEQPRRQADRALTAQITPIFAASRQIYGCPRVTAALRQQGQRGGKNWLAQVPAPDQPDQVWVADIARLDRLAFQRHLAARGIPVHYGQEDFEMDLAELARWGV